MNIGKNLEKMFSIEGKTVILTGAAGGIGAELAKGLAAAGGELILCDIAEDGVNALAEEIKAAGGKAAGYKLDVTDFDSFPEFVDKIDKIHGKLDVLINCAGINKRIGFLDFDEKTYDRIMDINLKGAFFLTQEVVKHMIPNKSGNIINVSSHNAVGMLGGCSVYGATKSAITALTRSMAIEWAKHGIRANAIAPGHILTALTTVTWETPSRAAYLKERIAMQRPGTPDELVGVVVMLASDASSYMSGMMIHIDGGCLAGGTPWDYDTNY
jgi:NAD(P)-dependent dehydrogenase (short-subunit alcohol dehydrogenase family)